ncbi:autotransporter outer membrane beta-barrel domain-containing protein [Brucella sp. IR073]|uniref:autotransporter outer membrane beta-barrel domain-containing protein n=1 Tax=unclassified Brucella TaxID=2632610 RepID=UPI003B97D6AF
MNTYGLVSHKKNISALMAGVAVMCLAAGPALADDKTLGEYAPGHYADGNYDPKTVKIPGQNDNKAGQQVFDNGTGNTLGGSYESVKGGRENWSYKTINEIAADGRLVSTTGPIPAGQLATGARNKTVSYFDPVTHENVTVNVFDTGKLDVIPNEDGYQIWDKDADQEAYIDPRLATVSNGSSLSVAVGNPNGATTAPENTLNMPVKAGQDGKISSAYKVEGDNSSLSYDTNTRFDLGSSDYEAPGNANRKADVTGVNFDKGAVIPEGATWINAEGKVETIPAGEVTDIDTFRNYNNYLIGQIQQGKIAGSTAAEIESKYRAALEGAYTRTTVTVEYTPADHPKYVQDQALGERSLIHATDGSTVTVSEGRTIEDVTGGSNHSIAYLQDKAKLENNGTLASRYSEHAIRGEDDAAVHNGEKGVISNFVPGKDGKPDVGEHVSNGVVLQDNATVVNDGIVNVGGSPRPASSPEGRNEGENVRNAGIILTDNAKGTNTDKGVINVGVNSPENVRMVDGVYLQDGAEFTNSGKINIGKTAQSQKGEAQEDVDSNSAFLTGIRAVDGGKVTNEKGTEITIGAKTGRAAAIYAGSSDTTKPGTVDVVNNGKITIDGNRAGTPNANFGIIAENVQGRIEHNGEIDLNGVNARGVYVLGDKVATHVDISKDATINVSGGFNKDTDTRNYGVWIQGGKATSDIDGTVNLDGQGGIGVHARAGGKITLGENASVNFKEGSDQIGYFIHGKDSAIAGIDSNLDVSTDNSTLFRIEDGADFAGVGGGDGKTLTASGENSTILHVTGNGAKAETGSGTYNLTGKGAVAVKVEGGAQADVAKDTKINLDADNSIAGIVDGGKYDLAGKYTGQGASKLDNDAEITSDKNGVTGFITRNGGHLDNTANITLTGDNAIGIKAENGGTAENTGNISVDNGQAIVANGGGKVENKGDIKIGKGEGIVVHDRATVNNTSKVTIGEGTGVRLEDNGVFNNAESGTITVDKGTGILVQNTTGEESMARISNEADITVKDGTAGVHIRDGAALDGKDFSGTLTVGGSAHGVLIGKDAAGLRLGDVNVKVTGSGNGIENEAETGNVELQGTVIDVYNNGSGIRTGTSFTSNSSATVNVHGDGGTGFRFEKADGSATSNPLVIGKDYKIALKDTSANATGVHVNTTGTAVVDSVLDDQGTGNTAVNIANAGVTSVGGDISVNTKAGSGGTGIVIGKADAAFTDGKVTVGASGGSALVVKDAGKGVLHTGTFVSASDAAVVDLSPSNGTTFISAGTITAKAHDAVAIQGGAGNDTIALMDGSQTTGIVRGGDGTDTIEWVGGRLVGSIEMGAGDNEKLTIVGRDLSTVYHLDGGAGSGDTLTLADVNYFGGTLDADDAFGKRVKGVNLGSDWENINLVSGTKFTLTDNLIYGNRLVLDGTSTLFAGNNVRATLGTAGSSFLNAGTVDLTNGSYSLADTVTVNGDYRGVAGSSIVLNTYLGADNSPTDKLIVTGGTEGETALNILRDPQSRGAQTKGDGIQVVRVDDDSASNAVFTAPTMYAGAYEYNLFQGGISNPSDGDWYLRSARSTGAQTVGVYGDTLARFGADTIGTLQQRTGGRIWKNDLKPAETVWCKDVSKNFKCELTPEQNGVYADSTGQSVLYGGGVWGRVVGQRDKLGAAIGSDYDRDLWFAQAGVEGVISENERGVWVGGIFGTYGKQKVDIDVSPLPAKPSVARYGQIDTEGYGIGGNLTWLGDNGLYFDGVAQYMWYRSDLTATGFSPLAEGNDGYSYSFSGEVGKRIEMGNGWNIVPQAQLVYTRAKFDGFNFANPDPQNPAGVDVTGGEGESLRGRIGVRIENLYNWTGADNALRRIQTYGIVNLHYEFLDGGKVKVAGDTIGQRSDRLWGEVGLGTSISLTENTSLYGEARYSTSLENFGDSHSYSGNIGLRIKW